MFRNEPRFGGVYSNDTLLAPKKGVGYIINLEDSDEGGSHWVALKDGAYFDSYGVPSTKAISKFVKHWNTEQYQSINQESCGFYAVYVLKNLFAGRPAYDKMIPMEHRYNENILKQFFF